MKGWGTGLFSFAAGCLVGVGLIHIEHARADSNRVFELLIYHTQSGQGAALESIFRDAAKPMADHGIDVVGYWVPNEDPAWADTFVYVVAHPSRVEANKNWDAVHHDPHFRPYIEAAKPILQKVNGRFNVDEVYMRPADFSPMK